jgi:FkbM family methyltransferase
MLLLQHPYSKIPLSPLDVRFVVDVGAFHGSYSVNAALSYPQATILAFEPFSASISEFRKNTENFSNRIKLFECALSDVEGESYLNLTSTGAANSLCKQTSEHARQNPHVVEVGQEKILVRTLDGVLKSDGLAGKYIDILKIDVEGLELNVLRGAQRSIAKSRFVIIEISLARDSSIKEQAVFDIFSMMKVQGFSLYSLIDLYPFEKPEPHLGIAQFDAIFKNTQIEDIIPL